MNTEEDEFKRIEREAVMRKQDDDDIQDYVETAKDRMFAIRSSKLYAIKR
jgi:hypothetical protein